MYEPENLILTIVLVAIFCLTCGYLVGKERGYLKGWKETHSKQTFVQDEGGYWTGIQDKNYDSGFYIHPEDENDWRQNFWKRGGPPPDFDPKFN